LAVGMDRDAHGRAEVFAEWRDRCGKSRGDQTSCARSAGWACRSGASASRIVPTRSGARGDLGALRPDGHRDFRSRSLLDGERLSGRKPLVWFRAPLERAQVHRPLSTSEEKAALFHGTAVRVYRIPGLELTAAAPSSADKGTSDTVTQKKN
jgi:hypothetical protein